MKEKTLSVCLLVCVLTFMFLFNCITTSSASEKEIRREEQLSGLQKRFEWWPTDASPGPVQDEERGGYWWWPTEPGKIRPWGNRGYIYVYKIIFDYKEEELPPAKPQELRSSLLIKKIIKNVKIYFDYNKAGLRDDGIKILKEAVGTLKRNPDASILLTGNCDIRGSEIYNEKLGRQRAEAVKKFMLENGIADERVRIVSRGKLDAVAPVTDLVGMQKDRNVHFVIAEIEEIMIPYPGEILPDSKARPLEEGKYIIEKEEKIESGIRVSKKVYTVRKGDSLWKIAERECGGGHRWKYIYELNKDKIKNPNNLIPGTKIEIPVE